MTKEQMYLGYERWPTYMNFLLLCAKPYSLRVLLMAIRRMKLASM